MLRSLVGSEMCIRDRSRHDVTPVLLKLEDAILTGATGTNVNDIKLMLVMPR